MNERQQELKRIEKEVAKCKLCKKNKFGLPVPGEGNPYAKIMFIGEAPGIEESKIGKPFVGRAGKFLNKLLELIKVKRSGVFLTSPLKYYPGKRSIRNWEIEHGKFHLKKQIEVIQPKIIVLLGNVAIKASLGRNYKVSKIHGKLIKKDNTLYYPTFHPSAAMRFPKIKELTIKDFIKLKKIISKLL